MDLFRLEVVPESEGVVAIVLSGHMTHRHIDQADEILTRANATEAKLVMNLQSLQLIDREAACFLRRWQHLGVELVNCPAYVQRWVHQC